MKFTSSSGMYIVWNSGMHKGFSFQVTDFDFFTWVLGFTQWYSGLTPSFVVRELLLSSGVP